MQAESGFDYFYDYKVVRKSLISKFGEEFLLIEVPVFIKICLFDELQDVIIADIDIQVLVKHCLNFVDAYKPLFLSIEQRKHIQCFLFPSSPEKPFFSDKIDYFRKRKSILILMRIRDFVFYLLAIHFSVCEIAKNASQVWATNVSAVGIVIKGKGILYLIFLTKKVSTMSSDNLLLRLLDFAPLGLLTFFFIPFISYKNIAIEHTSKCIIFNSLTKISIRLSRVVRVHISINQKIQKVILFLEQFQLFVNKSLGILMNGRMLRFDFLRQK